MWQDDAACQQHPADWWDMEGTTPQQRAMAVEICTSCPVQNRCLMAAAQDPPVRMIQGGVGWREGQMVDVSKMYQKHQEAS